MRHVSFLPLGLGIEMARRIFTFWFGLVVAVACHGSAFAGPVEDGLEAAKRSDYATALKLWLPAAEQGDANAQSYLGLLYLRGWGVRQDNAQAARWYRKAADQGNTAAQNNLATLYGNGTGVPQDYGQAFVLLRKAADAGAMEAYVNLARAYEAGRGVAKDCSAALGWYRKAVHGGYPGAREALADSTCRP